MKICWDNLEKLEYRQDRGEWQHKNQTVFYVYKDSCKNCGEPFLTQKGRLGIYCNAFCSNSGKNHPMYNKKHSEKTKMKTSKSLFGRIFSIEHRRNLSKSKIKFYKKPENNPNWKGGVTKKNVSFYDTYASQISFCEEVRRNKQDPNILEVKCAYCGKWYIPTLTSIKGRINVLNGSQTGEHRLYCSTQCKQECPIFNQTKWPKGFKPATSREVQPELRQMCFERDNYTCQKCGKTQDELDVGLQCHHIEGIRWEPLESADLDKVITFCKNCHIEVHKQPDCGYYDLRCK